MKRGVLRVSFLAVNKFLTVILIVAVLFTDLGHVFSLQFLPAIPEAEASVEPAIRVESFDQDVTTDGSTFTLANDVGATSSAFIKINTGTRKTSAGPTGSTGNIAPNIGTVGLVLTDTNEVTVERVNATEVKVIGEVWRYEGATGGGNEFIVRDRAVVSLTGSSQSTVIAGIVDADRVVPFITGYTVNGTSVNDWNDATIAAHIDDSGNLVVSRNNSGTAATVYVDVVEFTGSEWTVCHGRSSSHDTAEQTITLNTDSDGLGGATCDVTDWGTATIIEATMEGDSAETGLSDTLALVRPGNTATSVVFDLQQDTGARNDGEAWIHVLQNDGLVVNRESNANLAEGNGVFGTATYPSGATTTAAFNTLSLEWFTDTSGVGTAHMRGGLHARIIGETIYADGDSVVAADYDSTVEGNFAGEVTFAATPAGVIYEAGGTGTGSFVGYNDAGDFIIRAGNGASVSPTDVARIVIDSGEFDFSGRTGTLVWNFFPTTESVDLSFDEDSDGSIDYSTSTTAAAAWANWSGGDDGNVGNSNGNVAGSEITSGFDFNGTIDEIRFTQGGPQITHWIHRDGNNVGVEYGVVELAGLAAVTDTTLVAASGTQATSVDIPSVDNELGGSFVITELASSRNITDVTLTESGTIDAQNGLTNIKLFYDLDTTVPLDCSSESFAGTEDQFGDTDTNGFSGADGIASFTAAGAVTISTAQAFCGYVVYDVTASSSDGDTIEIALANPSVDVVVSGGGTVSPSSEVGVIGSTTARSAELTQTHFRWLNDDGAEGAATAIEAEDVATAGFANGTIRRLRLQVDAAGSTSSVPTTFQLDYATKTASCALPTEWIDVGAAGGVWDIANSGFITDGTNATDIGTGSGGVTNPGGQTFLSTNGGLRDTSSQTGSLTLAETNFVEFEFAIEPTATAPQGNTYCFRVSDAGADLRNYDVYAEGTLSADVDVSAAGSQVASVDVGSTAQDLGGAYVISRTGSNQALTSVTLKEVGTIDGQNNLSNITLEYDVDTSVPANCESESNDGDESTYGSVDVDGFSGPNGTSTFSAIETVGTNRSLCFYVVVDVESGAADGETIEVEITNPSTDVTVLSSSVAPGSIVSPTGSTTVSGPVRTQTGYHWRNDDGSETDATSATADTQDTALLDVPKNTLVRLRLQVDNEGAVTTAASSYRLEFGTKVTTCEAVSSWNDVGTGGGAFDMADSSNLTEGSDTTDVALGTNGAISDPGGSTFLSTNGGQRDLTSQAGSVTLSATQYVEFEYALEATIDAGDDTTYCFRVTDAGTELEQYTSYAELTTREKQDFFIQRGTTVISGTTTVLVAGADYTAPSATSSAFVRITNSKSTGAGHDVDDDDNTRSPDGWSAYIEDQSDITSSFTLSRPSDVAESVNTRVSWEVIEFTGLTGTDNEMIVRDVAAVTYGATNLHATGSSAEVSDDSDVVVFITGQFNPSTDPAQSNDGISTSFWHSTSAVPVFTRGDADSVAARVSYAVVEFSGANWKIQRVEHAYATINAETESITAVGSVNQVFLHTQKRTGDEVNGLHDMGHEVYVSGVGTITFELHDGTNPVTDPTEHDGVAWVIENTQTGSGAMAVYRSDGSVGGGAEPTIHTFGIGATVDTDNASIFVNNNSTGAGTAFPRSILGVFISSPTQYQLFVSDTGQTQFYRTEVVEWPVAEISIRQNYYRFYVDNDAIDPTDPWPVGVADLGENTSITGADDPLGEGERVRIRMSLLVNNATLPADIQSFKLQFARLDTTCSAVSVWTDVGAVGSGEIWRGFDGTPVDGTELATSTPAAGRLNLSLSDVAGTYEEENVSVVNPHSVDLGEDVEYDWLIEHNGATQRSDYCFRMVENDGTELDGYNNYPTLRTTGYTPVSHTWQWFDDATSITPSTTLANEEVAPTDVANENEIKLRVVVSEVESAAGENVKFTLQFSDFADFSSNVEFLTATSSCVASSTWCYADGAGIDGALIDSAVLSTADSCIAGVGSGCGTHNEASSTASTLTQPALSNMEFEFALEQRAARAGGVYYFRLYDVTNDEPVVASSTFPSLAVLGPQLTFTAAAVGSGTVTEGITADVDTTPTAIPFGSVPLNTEYEAVYRMTVDTSATEGYQLLMYARQPLTNSYGGVISDIAGTNASPLAWSTGCSVSADGCFGYHTGDDILSGGSTRFSPNDSYARVSTTTPDEIMAASTPTEDTVDIVYKIQVREGQPAGDYETEIVYLAVPVF